MVVGSDRPTKKGFGGSRINHCRILDDQDVQLLEELRQVNMQNPLKNSGDILTLYTAIKENIDYLVTKDTRFKKSLELFKVKKDTMLQVIDHEGFKGLL